MDDPSLILVLGDQLTPGRCALAGARPGVDSVVMAEVREEAGYVAHNKHKIALIFAAMRHFRDALRDMGFAVHYYPYEAGIASISDAIDAALDACDASRVRVCEPGEYRLQAALRDWQPGVPVDWVTDDRFLASADAFKAWAKGRKQLRMEHFYRRMRVHHALLLEADDQPAGGRWNYDSENRKGWRSQQAVPARPEHPPDQITQDVIALVEEAFPEHPGDLSRFYLATDRAGAELALDWFLEHALAHFGRYQDALAEESPWLFHSLISMYINIGLLDPLSVCRAVETAWREDRCDLAAAEGFIRQILGWREYIRGIYWLHMPDYAARNSLQADTPLPAFFWNADTDLRCLSRALEQTLELGYAHHIQRLMVIGNFCLLAGLAVKDVCDWYLAVYVDAFEWVELPNTLGMALHADDGLMASKPYAASGKYIQRQGDHCKTCRYDPKKTTGNGACPYNSLYWRFINRHIDRWQDNPRMALSLRNWQRKPAPEREAILRWADAEHRRLTAP
ncbi:MAG: cryptochrome/photolyase family protein [Halioglobus sp.]